MDLQHVAGHARNERIGTQGVELFVRETLDVVKERLTKPRGKAHARLCRHPLGSEREAHARCGKQFLTVTPGVRFADGNKGDQVRVMTPAEAKKIGSDYIVVGRPITAADDPVAAYERCVREFVD